MDGNNDDGNKYWDADDNDEANDYRGVECFVEIGSDL